MSNTNNGSIGFIADINADHYLGMITNEEGQARAFINGSFKEILNMYHNISVHVVEAAESNGIPKNVARQELILAFLTAISEPKELIKSFEKFKKLFKQEGEE